MTGLPGAWSVDLAVPCPDPECRDPAGHRSLAEPDADGEHRFYECTSCGYTFGFHRPATPVAHAAPGTPAESGGCCAVGVPETLRRAASAPMLASIAAASPGPLLTIGRRTDGHSNADPAA